MGQIKLLVMDVDGTLTDGQIFISNQGECMKGFDVKDGYGIKHLLPQAGISSAIITGRTSQIVQQRVNELSISYLYQGISDKDLAIRELKEQLELEWENIAYIGDDLNDLPAMKLAGYTACPADAVKEVKDTCHYICNATGGHGAVRELIEWIIDRKNND